MLMNLMRHGCASDAYADPCLRELYFQIYPFSKHYIDPDQLGSD